MAFNLFLNVNLEVQFLNERGRLFHIGITRENNIFEFLNGSENDCLF